MVQKWSALSAVTLRKRFSVVKSLKNVDIVSLQNYFTFENVTGRPGSVQIGLNFTFKLEQIILSTRVKVYNT